MLRSGDVPPRSRARADGFNRALVHGVTGLYDRSTGSASGCSAANDFECRSIGTTSLTRTGPYCSTQSSGARPAIASAITHATTPPMSAGVLGPGDLPEQAAMIPTKQ